LCKGRVEQWNRVGRNGKERAVKPSGHLEGKEGKKSANFLENRNFTGEANRKLTNGSRKEKRRVGHLGAKSAKPEKKGTAVGWRWTMTNFTCWNGRREGIVRKVNPEKRKSTKNLRLE